MAGTFGESFREGLMSVGSGRIAITHVELICFGLLALLGSWVI
jgi:hypothetical protein